ncbi:MAG: hypothetical protein QME12_06925 [Nanoarchaeota archaeon]|nr:hypothetical protein [Nanoarchaeota archaeon]
MGVEDIPDEEFESFIQKEKKRRKRIKILAGIGAAIAAAGIYSGAGYLLCRHAESIRDYAIEESIPRITQEEAMQIQAEVKTPLEAAVRISRDIEFSPEFDLNRFGLDYWSSLQETYGMGQGECEDGAIAFKAMLADNPEYNVSLIWLQSKSENMPSHMIAAYSEKGLWGIASFNNLSEGENVSRLYAPIFSSMEHAIKAYAEDRFESWHTVDISDYDLLLGRNLSKNADTSGKHQL